MKQKRTKNYGAEINQWLEYHESYDSRRQIHDLDFIADRIAWCWKFRKITREQMESFCDRIIALFEELQI